MTPVNQQAGQAYALQFALGQGPAAASECQVSEAERAEVLEALTDLGQQRAHHSGRFAIELDLLECRPQVLDRQGLRRGKRHPTDGHTRRIGSEP